MELYNYIGNDNIRLRLLQRAAQQRLRAIYQLARYLPANVRARLVARDRYLNAIRIAVYRLRGQPIPVNRRR